jgi:hypothetical protein
MPRDHGSGRRSSGAAAVDAYLGWCAERGKEPSRPFSGRLNLRIDPGLHREAALAAAAGRTSLNAFLVACIEHGLQAFRSQPSRAADGAVELDPAFGGGGGRSGAAGGPAAV